jgi:tetratricopeptide (TPR) repeat protein
LLKKIIISVFLIVFVFANVFTVSAATSESFNRADVPGNSTELRLSREMYEATKEITATTLGSDKAFEGITDIHCTENNDIYLLCGEESRLVFIDKDFTYSREVVITDSQGNELTFKGAQGIYTDRVNNIYIADTSNARVIIANSEGHVIKILEDPKSDLIPSDFLYQPISIEKDEHGYTYILSLGCYYGALMYTPEYEFMGFYGPNTVKSSALDTLSYLWEKLTSTEEKKTSSIKKLPYSFSDFAFDPEGFLVTTTGAVTNSIWSEKNIGQIKKISHNGANILFKRNLQGESTDSTNVDFVNQGNPVGSMVQSLTSVDVSEDDYIFALDSGRGFIYIYDTECNLMTSFGGGYRKGQRVGVFEKPVALTLQGNNILVADMEKYCITIFNPTEYGNLIRKAQSLYINGDYNEANEAWHEVLKMNRNCQLAYRGIAMGHYNSGNYKAALEAAKVAADYAVYDLAWKQMVSNFVADYFVWIVLAIALIVAAIIYFAIKLKKKNKKLINNKKLKLFLDVPFHPFNSFDELKYKKMGSLKIATVMMILFYVASVLNVTSSGFLYTNILLRNYNSLYTIAGTIGLILLWSVGNWLVCSMFNGKGSLKDVYTGTCYAIMPWVVFQFVKILLSNVLPLSVSGIVTGLGTVMLIYTFFLLAVAMMKVHEYDFFKFLWTGLAIIFFMILVVFIILMCAILIAQFWTFIASVYDEVVHR